MSDVARAAQVVKELFGRPCPYGRMAVTLDFIPCGTCFDCTRDWIPEAQAILTAASPTEVPVSDELADQMRVSLDSIKVEVRMTSGYDDGIVDVTRPALPVRYQHRFVTEWMDEQVDTPPAQ